MVRIVRSVVLLLGFALGLLPLVLAGPAAADPPFRLDEQVVDRAGVLDEAAVRPALDDLRADTGAQLFVAFVDSFDGLEPQAWADRTATTSGLGTEDYLLAVAVRDRSYAYSAGTGSGLSDDELERVAVERIEPRLAADDWDGAVEAAAQGYREALDGSSDGAAGGGGGIGLGVPLAVIGGGAVALGAFALSRRRKARPAPAPSGRPAVPTEELEREANRLLVETDDAVRASDQELGFAVAEFGEGQTASFSQALAEARRSLQRGFTVQQQLADDVPESEEERRRLLTEVIDLCTRADALLDAEAERFDQLRDVLTSAPQRLQAALERADALEQRVPAAEAELERLRGRYAAPALARVERNPAEARDRLEFARETARRGQAALESTGTRGEAAVAVRAADEALAQVEKLLDAVAQAGRDLGDAVARLPGAIADLRSDLDAARAEGAPPAAIEAVASALAQADQAAGSDPLGALHRVVEADAALEQARAGAREAAAAREAAERSLEQALTSAEAEIAAVEDFVATRRGAVGSDARTRLAEASRHLSRAHELRAGDPAAALEAARTADRLAEDAGRLAQADVEEWYAGQGGYGAPGGFGGPVRRGPDGSAVLAGILLGQVLGGGRGGGFGGGYGGGYGGGFGGGGFGGGFGGSGRRRSGGGGFGQGGGRRGGGGRF